MRKNNVSLLKEFFLQMQNPTQIKIRLKWLYLKRRPTGGKNDYYDKQEYNDLHVSRAGGGFQGSSVPMEVNVFIFWVSIRASFII